MTKDEIPFGNIRFKFGKHKGLQLKDAPDDYLKFLMKKNILKGKMLFHCQVRFDVPKEEYKVIVTDAIVGDGEYIIKAYNKRNALDICVAKNHIQCSQSGTYFDIIKL